jgi:hypothetical protein
MDFAATNTWAAMITHDSLGSTAGRIEQLVDRLD